MKLRDVWFDGCMDSMGDCIKDAITGKEWRGDWALGLGI